MPASPLNAQDVARITRQMLRPYLFPSDSPYISADQQRLSAMNLQGRSAWMAEWLQWAQKPVVGLAMSHLESFIDAERP